MGKVLIQEMAGSKPVPFLRGILTRSLQDAGLGFRDAYRLATRIRHMLARGTADKVVATGELRRMVEGAVREKYGEIPAERYRVAMQPAATIRVISGEGQPAPFSRSELQRRLEPCGLGAERSTAIVAAIYEQILRSGLQAVTTDQVRAVAAERLREDEGPEYAKRYLAWSDFVRSRRPLLLLIGGVPGCGKSTIATELAHRLDIVRIQSTDMLREVMRMMVPARIAPALHTSSFNAGKELPMVVGAEEDQDRALIAGYRTQSDLVAAACEGAVNRALRERVSLILEGVHIHPGLLGRFQPNRDALVVPVMLGVLKPDDLKDRYKGRSKHAPDRRKKRYLKSFDNIWRLQSYLLDEADQSHIHIVANVDKEQTIQGIIGIIIDRLEGEARGKR